MIRNKAAKAVAFLGLLGLAAACCSADTVLVDTITGGKYQIGSDITRVVNLGYEAYPWAGDFTGVRPVFGAQPSDPVAYTYTQPDAQWDATSQSSIWGVTHRGASGVACTAILKDDLSFISGAQGAWVVQPFTPGVTGSISAVTFIAQFRTPAAYLNSIDPTNPPARASKAYVNIIEKPASGSALPGDALSGAVEVNLSSATVGKAITVSIAKGIASDKTYWLVIAPQSALTGQCDANVLDYANLNWYWKAAAHDSAKVSEVLYNNLNGSGSFYPVPMQVLGFSVQGSAQQTQIASISGAKGLADGTLVTIQDGAFITAKSNPDGVFYIEGSDRLSGIRIIGNAGTISLNEKVSVTGTITTVGSEKAVTLSSAPTDLSATAEVKPYGMASTSVGLLNNVGLLVRVWGRVQGGSGSVFTLVDGSGTGVQCSIIDSSIALPADGAYIGVTGVSSKAAGTNQVLVVGIRTY